MRLPFALLVLVVAACGEIYGETEMGSPPPVSVDGGRPEGDGGAVPLDATTDQPSRDCTADEAECTNEACAPKTCLVPDHVPTGFGTYLRAEGLTGLAMTDAVLDTKTGAFGAFRAANDDPSRYEVKDGIGFVLRAKAAGGAEALWTFESLALAGRLTVTGTAAVMLAARTTLNVMPGAAIDVSARGIAAGPGGALGGTMSAGGGGCGGGTGTSDGAGGGGFGTNGGSANGVPGGLAVACDALDLRAAFVGGSGGGGSDEGSGGTGVFGGGGGGVLQLTAMGTLTIGGSLLANGGGGRTPGGNGRNGAGGGSGGLLYLEAPSVVLRGTAAIFANGGGGGSSSTNLDPCFGSPATAEDGRASASTAASGGRCGRGVGGSGAVGSAVAGGGQTFSAFGYGGGGGGLGRLVVHTRPGGLTVEGAPQLSPALASAAAKTFADW